MQGILLETKLRSVTFSEKERKKVAGLNSDGVDG